MLAKSGLSPPVPIFLNIKKYRLTGWAVCLKRARNKLFTQSQIHTKISVRLCPYLFCLSMPKSAYSCLNWHILAYFCSKICVNQFFFVPLQPQSCKCLCHPNRWCKIGLFIDIKPREASCDNILNN